jgi:hypothetical protein
VDASTQQLNRSVVCWLLLFVLLPLDRSPAVLSAQESPVYQPREMRADLQRFGEALTMAHPGIDSVTAERLDETFADLLAEASTPLSSVEFHLLVMRLTAALHDGHTRAFLGDPTRSYVNSRGLLPFHVTIRDQRIFILRDLSGADLGDGSEILTIDGTPANSILRRVEEYLGVDGASASGLAYRLGGNYTSFYRVFPLVFGLRRTYDLAIDDARSGAIREITVGTIGPGDFQRTDQERYGEVLHLQSLEDELARPPVTLDVDSASRYAVLRIRRFFKDGFDEPSSTYPDLFREAFRQFDEAGVLGLIVDLRGNGGGIGANAAHLVTFLSDSTFTPTLEMSFRGNDGYYASITSDDLALDEYFGLAPAGDRYVITRTDSITELESFSPAAEYRFRGRLVVLIDGGTVSAAGMAAGLLQQYTDAIFVGQETGGYAGMSNGLRQLAIRGEHTDTGINFPLAHSEFAVNPHRRRRGVVPDHPVSSSVEELVAGRDAALELAVGLVIR